VAILNSNARIILGTNKVDVSVLVDKLIERELQLNVKVDNGDPDYNYVLFPSKIKLKVTTAFNKVGEIDTSLYRASVNISQRKNNHIPINLAILPEGVHLVGMEPKEVEFLIIKKK
jgi:hypothetical protein